MTRAVKSLRRRLLLCGFAALLCLPLVAGPVAGADAPTRLVYKDGGITFVADGDGSDPVLIPNSRRWQNPAWSPDGTRLAFSLNSDDTGYDDEIYMATGDGEIAGNLTDNGNNERFPFWSPDGTRIGYVRGNGIWSMNIDGTDKRRLFASLGNYTGTAKWSPDGKSIAYSYTTYANGTYTGHIGLVLADGSNAATPIQIGGDEAGLGDWSPDGSQIAFTRFIGDDEGQGYMELRVASVDGTSDQLLHTAPRILSVAWSPTTSDIAFVSGGDLYSMPAAGGDPVLLVDGEYPIRDVDWGHAIPCTVTGSNGSDLLEGTAGKDVICAGGGADRIIGTEGADTVLGGLGADKIDYRTAAAGVTADLRDATVTLKGREATVLGVETVLGSNYDDTIFGNDQRNVVAGYGGNDGLIGRGGDDTLNGGDGDDVLRPGVGGDDANGGLGRDTVSFFDAAARVRVNLSNNYAFGQGEDIVVEVEKVVGSDHDDFIVGTNGPNVLRGGDGEDQMDGQGGPDDLYGGDERDFLYGRDGSDDLFGDAGRDYIDGGAQDDDCYSAIRTVSC